MQSIELALSLDPRNRPELQSLVRVSNHRRDMHVEVCHYREVPQDRDGSRAQHDWTRDIYGHPPKSRQETIGRSLYISSVRPKSQTRFSFTYRHRSSRSEPVRL